MPKMQKQSYSSKNCPAFAAAYMVDLCDQRFVFGALYVDSQSQRNWVVHVLETGVLLPCPRLALKPTKLVETNLPEPKLFCSKLEYISNIYGRLFAKVTDLITGGEVPSMITH